MAANQTSIIQLADIVEEYLVQERYDYESIAARLRLVTGNKSTIESCRLLADEIMERAPSR